MKFPKFLRVEWPPQPRHVTADEVADWFSGAAQAEKPPSVMTREVLLSYLRHKNPVRMRRLNKDFSWMQRELKKLKRSPEDARWLL